MQIEQIRDVKLLKSMAEAAQCHIKRIEYCSPTSKDKNKDQEDIKAIEADLLRIHFRILEIEGTEKAIQTAWEMHTKK